MATIILSIKPKYANTIINGIKGIEYRKKIWKDAQVGDRVIIYASSPVQRVIGEFRVNAIMKSNHQDLWRPNNGLSTVELGLYFNGKQGYAIIIDSVQAYPIHKSLSDFGIHTPPQNFCYAKFSNNN